ncbi:hypothetical protein OAJ03_04935, partial [Candidatus Pelagibacter sp.]|nr:hypothetical protein [Candidatus Pelagibacter sp.]
KYISQNKPSQKIVIRPHFAENIKDWENKFKNIKNVKVVNSGDISSWIMASKIILHNGSTTGIQSYVMDKPVIIYSTKVSKIRENTFPNKYGIRFNTKQKILRYLNNFDFEKNKKIKKIKVGRIKLKNTFASNEIVNVINKIKIKQTFKYKSLIPILLNIYFLKRKIRFFNKSNSISRTYIRNYNEKMPGGIKKFEIDEFIKKLENYFNIQNSIKVRYCGPNCFLIYKK